MIAVVIAASLPGSAQPLMIVRSIFSLSIWKLFQVSEARVAAAEAIDRNRDAGRPQPFEHGEHRRGVAHQAPVRSL
jgi:hypothetical protein